MAFAPKNINKYSRRALAASGAVLALLSCSYAFANPADGTVSAGSATIQSQGNTLNIHQSTNRAVIDWRSFDIDANEETRFYQPSSNSFTLNRVHSSNASKISGKLTANGGVMILNQNGVVFGQGSQVDVGSLVVSTANIDNDAFMAGNYVFDQAGNPDAEIVNNGTITVQDAGLVGFVAPQVKNNGVINAKMGTVALASGDTFAMDMYGDNLIQVAVSDDVSEQIVSHAGTINAQGGNVQITAGAARDVVDSLIDVSGDINATRIDNKGGRILIQAEGSNGTNKSGNSTVLVSGHVNATGNKDGGKIEILGDQVALTNGAVVDASGAEKGGTVHVGGEYLGGGDTQRAKATVVQSGATVKANGGDGEVILWSDKYTNFAGTIEANGEGSFVETSSKDILTATGRVYAEGGEWLLDPSDITIRADAGGAPDDTNVPTAPIFDGSGGGSVVTTQAIVTALGGADVTIRTDTGGGGNGDIFIDGNISYAGATERTLLIQAYRNIDMDGNSIISTTGQLNVTLNSRFNAGSATGYVRLNNSTITTNGGDLLIGGGVGAAGNAIGVAGFSGITVSGGAMSAGGGNITMRGQSGVGAADTSAILISAGADIITTGSGNITLTGTGGSGNQNMTGITIDGASTNVRTAEGDITITGQGGAATGSGANGVFIGNSARIQSTGTGGANKIDIHGTAGTTGGGGSTGVYLYNADVDSAAADIEIDGLGNTSGGDYNMGMLVEGNSAIFTTSGDIDLYGQGGAGNSISHGFSLAGVGSIAEIYSTSGNIRIEGIGGNGISSGVDIEPDSRIYTTTATAGLGNIELIGTGGTGGDYAGGVYLATNGSVTNVVQTSAGDITLTGQGGTGASNEVGVWISNNAGILTVDGDVNITGTGGTGTTDIHGVYLVSNSYVRTTNGNITMSGTTADNDSYGVYIAGGSDVTATGAVTGDITITATSAFTDFRTAGATVNIGDITTTDSLKNITINADEVQMANTSIDTTGIVTFAPRTAGQTINVSSATTGGLDLTAAELAFVSNNVSKLVVGSASAGTGAVNVGAWDLATANRPYDVEVYGGSIDMSGAMSFDQANDILFSARTGNITLDQTITKSGGAASTLTAKAAGSVLQSANILSSSGALNTILWADAEAAPNSDGYISITSAGITTLGGNVYLVGGLDDGANGGVAADGIGDNYAWGIAGNAEGIKLSSADILTGDGYVLFRGHGYDGATNASHGVLFEGDSDILTNNGSISIYGTSGAGGDSSHGIYLSANDISVITSGGGIILEGTANAAAGSGNVGILINGNPGSGTDVLVRSATGDIRLTANGGGTGTNNYALRIDRGYIESTGTSKATAGTITLQGYGSVTSTGGYNMGVYLLNSDIVSVAGDILVEGVAGKGAQLNDAVNLSGGTIVRTTGTGADAASITLDGFGDGQTSGSYAGVRINNSTVRTADGWIDIDGVLQNNTGAYGSVGVWLENGGLIYSDNGLIDVNGAVDISGAANLFGIFLNQGTDIYTTGTGDIILTAASANGIDFYTNGAGTVQIGQTGHADGDMTGDITINANEVQMANTSIDTTGIVTIAPRTAGQTINVSTATTGGLDLTAAELAFVSNNVSKLVVGSASAGTGAVNIGAWDLATANRPYDVEVYGGSIDMSGAMSFDQANDILFVARTGDVILDQTITKSGGGASTFKAKAADDIDISANLTSSSGTLNVVLWSDAETVPNNDGHIYVMGADITTLGGNLYLVGGLDDGSNGGVAADGIGDGYAWGDAAGGTGITIGWGGTVISTGAGNILMRAQGTGANSGLSIDNGSVLTVSDGDIGIYALSGTGAGGWNSGFNLSGSAQINSTGSGASAGNIYINATTNDPDGDSYGGFNPWDNSIVSAVDGNIEIVASGGVSQGFNNPGMYLQGGSSAKIETTGDGNITLTGTGSTSGSATDGNYGVLIESGFTVNAAGTGNIEITGDGGSNATGSNNSGIRIDGTVSALSGTVLVDGTAGTGTTDIHGLHIGGGTVSTTSGNITVTGTTSDNDSYGVNITGGGNIQSTAATIGDIIINAISNNFTDFRTTGATVNIGDVTTIDSLKNITINADDVEMANTSIATLGNVIFKPRTVGRNINLGGGTGALDLSDAELAMIDTNVDTLIIGDSAAGTGLLTVDTWDFSAMGYDVELYGGSIVANGITPGSNALIMDGRTGDVTFNQDTLGLAAGSSITALDDIFVLPTTNSATIGLGGGAGMLNLTDAELAYFSAGDRFIIGNGAAGTGLVTIDTWDFSAKAHDVEIQGGDIAANGIVQGTNALIMNARTGDVTITQDTLDLAAGSSISAFDDVIVKSSTPSASIGISGGAGTLNLTDTELGYFTVGDRFVIGDGSAGTGLVTIDGWDFSANTYDVEIQGGDIVANDIVSGANALIMNARTGDVTITQDTIALAVGSAITSFDDIFVVPSTTSATIGLGGGAGTLNLTDTELGYFTAGDRFIIGSSSAGTGLVTIDTWDFSGNSFDLEVYGGSIVADDITSGANTLIMNARTGDVTITQDSLALAAGSDISAFDDIIVKASTASRAINIGGGAGGLDISDAELAMFDAADTLIIGDSAAGTGAVTITSADVSAGGYDLEIHGGEITVNGGLTGGGSVFLNARNNSDIILNSAVTGVGAGNSIVLNAEGDFINNHGAGALVSGAGRFLVYALDKATAVFGTLTGSEIFNQTFGTMAPGAVPGVANTFIFAGANPGGGGGGGGGGSGGGTSNPAPSTGVSLPDHYVYTNTNITKAVLMPSHEQAMGNESIANMTYDGTTEFLFTYEFPFLIFSPEFTIDFEAMDVSGITESEPQG